MSSPIEAMDIEVMTTKDAAEKIVVVEAPESVGVIVVVPQSPRTLRLKKDKYAMISVRVSPRNPQRTKLTLQEKGNAINLEADEEEPEEILLEEENLQMEVETQGGTLLPSYSNMFLRARVKPQCLRT